MAAQSRRSISVKGLTYQRIQKFVDKNGGSISSFVEELLAEKIGEPDEEDRRKFGEAMVVREKKVEATKAKTNDDFTDYVDPILLL